MTSKTGLATALVAAVVAAIVSAATLLIVGRTAPGVATAPTGGLDEKQVIEVVRHYLTENPEILVEMTTKLDKIQQEKQAADQVSAISENSDALFRSTKAFGAGNPDGDVTVVEFFDYNCGFCRRAMPEVVKLVDNDDKVKVKCEEVTEKGERYVLSWPKALELDSIGVAMVAASGRGDFPFFDYITRFLAVIQNSA